MLAGKRKSPSEQPESDDSQSKRHRFDQANQLTVSAAPSSTSVPTSKPVTTAAPILGAKRHQQLLQPTSVTDLLEMLEGELDALIPIDPLLEASLSRKSQVPDQEYKKAIGSLADAIKKSGTTESGSIIDGMSDNEQQEQWKSARKAFKKKEWPICVRRIDKLVDQLDLQSLQKADDRRTPVRWFVFLAIAHLQLGNYGSARDNAIQAIRCKEREEDEEVLFGAAHECLAPPH